MLRLILSKLILIASVLLPSLPAFAGSDPASPVGMWELKVGGTFEGERVNGIAYLEFEADGTMNGYYLSRLSFSLTEVSGTWSQAGTRFTGSVDVDDGEGIFASFAMSGVAKATKSLSAKLTDDFGSQISIAGKPLVLMTDLAGTYTGSVRQYGYQGTATIELVADQEGGYVLSGTMVYGAETYVLAGYVVARRDGAYVAFIENQTQGIYSSIWGKIKPGQSFTGSGVSLDDYSSIRVAMSPTG